MRAQGGIMQTEEVVPRAQSTGIDGSLTDSTSFEHPLHRSPLLQSPLPSSILMAVKQEPQEDDERSRDTNTLSQQADVDAALSPVEAGHLVHHHAHDAGLHNQVQGTEMTAGSTGQDNSGRARSSRRRRKSRWKLKFHHQALPPEYLDHYEATLAQEALNSSPNHMNESTIPSPAPTTSTSTSGSTPSPVGDVQGWLQRIAAMQQELYPRVVSSNEPLSLGAPYRRSVITSTTNPHPAGANHKNHHHNHQQNHHNTQVSQHHQVQQQPTPRPPMKYSDLPYMGEITLDNSKPRRGRKPKKADICHLIYKNYGTILPGTPGHEERKQQQQQQQQQQHASKDRPEATREQIQHHQTFQRTDIQNRISSLLEKRLTQESRKSLATIVDSHREQDEPLNLCIRDLNQLKIRILRKHGNVYESGNVKSEVSSDTDEVECLGTSFNGAPEATRSNEFANMSNNNSLVALNNNNNNEPLASPNNSGFVYWPNAGVLIHPMALQSQFLYYQKMAQNEKSLVKLTDAGSKEQKIVPKSIYTMLERSKSPTSLATGQGAQTSQQPIPLQSPPSPRPKRNAPVSHQIAPMKRKRSAIFIPPLPTENNNNPPTEVSICKFKFTGGAKPSLQEKKSLSVDSDGTFRYYTGTGDKSMRGYSVFPRESLQQPAGQAGTSAGAFLSATGERIPPPMVQCQRTANATVAATAVENDIRRKRKTRKSLQREKLEQTFKEKGFLIQTQQLESAEGATYCKFRQLRKFTRYLFRSWKDYLPGDVCDLSANANGHRVMDPDAITESQHPIVDSTVSLAGIIDMPNNPGLEQHRTLPLT
ncbi:uncharacterized protein [Venturia canescens]|uniref:uncharacterized protein isoform X2 n=1 Tax=Venturia canescens TaxID=32260 RepID=UPI001C9C77D2|nr:uncharacterized protein LOC122407070 isoform X2 [Venturia canescens]